MSTQEQTQTQTQPPQAQTSGQQEQQQEHDQQPAAQNQVQDTHVEAAVSKVDTESEQTEQASPEAAAAAVETATTSEAAAPAVSSSNGEGEVASQEHSDDTQVQPQQHPEPAPALATEGGREVSHKILYVGGLNKSVSEETLNETFSIGGPVQSIKILVDKNNVGLNYAFVEYDDEQAAETALKNLNGKIIDDFEIKINWAYQSQQAKSTPDSFNIFVGDLSSEVDDELLKKSFSKFNSLIQAHVMWDMQSGRSRGYGFVSFIEQKDAEDALYNMNGEWIGGRQIRLNWASHKQQNNQFRNNRHHRHHHNHHNGLINTPNIHNNYSNNNLVHNGNPINNGAGNGLAPIDNRSINPSASLNLLSPQSYDLILRKAPSWQTTVYLGNLAHFTTQNDLIPLLQNFGFIVDLKFYPEKGCAFVKYDSHERAALAIVQLSGFMVNGRPLKCGWGKDRPANLQYQNYGHIVYGGQAR